MMEIYQTSYTTWCEIRRFEADIQATRKTRPRRIHLIKVTRRGQQRPGEDQGETRKRQRGDEEKVPRRAGETERSCSEDDKRETNSRDAREQRELAFDKTGRERKTQREKPRAV